MTINDLQQQPQYEVMISVLAVSGHNYYYAT